jgi:NADH:ubiquinone oxidoreductase subunit F (NADH-binding)
MYQMHGRALIKYVTTGRLRGRGGAGPGGRLEAIERPGLIR